MLKLIEAGFLNEPITFNWDIADQCQFDCSYCYNRDMNTIHSMYTTSSRSYQFVLARLARVASPWHIEIQGGEPTLHPHIHDVLVALDSMPNCQSIVVATNLAGKDTIFCELSSVNKVSIHMSYHPEYHSGWGERIVKIGRQIGVDKFFVEVIIHDDPTHIAPTVHIIKLLDNMNIPFGITLLHPTKWYTPNYTDEVYAAFSHWMSRDDYLTGVPHIYDDKTTMMIGEHEIHKRQIQYGGMVCDARMFTISTNGTITNTCNKQPATLTIEASPIICPKTEGCSCSQMLRYKKHENA